MAFSINMLNKMNQGRTNIYDLSCMWHLKETTAKTTKKQQKLTDTENRLMVARGGAEG